MEARNGSASYGNKHKRPNGTLRCARVQIGKREFHQRARSRICQRSDRNADGHKNKEYAEDRVKARYNLIDGKQRCKKIVNKYNDGPYFYVEPFGGEQGQKAGGPHHKYDADHHKQDDSEYAHNVLHRGAQIFSGNFGDTCAVVAHRQHA